LKDSYHTNIKPKLLYMTYSEQLLFRSMRATGALSMYRCTSCARCGAEIPIPKKYCNKSCMEAHAIEREREQEHNDEQDGSGHE
jgi:hypothetical protein